MDPRIQKLADLIVNWCIDIKQGDKLCLVANHVSAQPFYEAVKNLAILKGAMVFDRFMRGAEYVDIVFSDYELIDRFSAEQITVLPKNELDSMADMDAVVGIESQPESLKYPVDPIKLATWSRNIDPISQLVLEKRYVYTFFPTAQYAAVAGISLSQLEDIFYAACFYDRQRLFNHLSIIKNIFDGAKEVHIVGKKSDLSFSIEGRPGIIDVGKENLPGGEVYFAPIEDSLQGVITFGPASYYGRDMGEIMLKFSKGKVVHARCQKSPEILDAVLETDLGSRFVGEFGIGGNPAATIFIGDPYLDEINAKSIHLALGNSYSECQGSNQSAVHFDLIRDLSGKYEICVDGKVINKSGEWIDAYRKGF